MGKSLGNAVYLSDDESTVTNKVKSALTDTNRIAVSDKGNPDVCMVSQYQKAFNADDYENICDMCRSAKIGCVACKKVLCTKLNDTFTPIRERRAFYEMHKNDVREMIMSGTSKANKLGAETTQKIKRAMNILL